MTKTPIETAAALVQQFVAAVTEQEVLALQIVQAELGLTRAAALPVTPAQSEAETEASFDNMPV